MKRLLWIMLSISLNIAGMHSNARIVKNGMSKRNTQLCLNTTPDFGTRHFIVGYKEKNVPARTVHEIKEKKQPKTVSQKKQKAVFGGAELIDKNRTTQSFFTTIHDLSDILLHIISQAQKSLYIAAFTLTDQRIADLIIEKYKNGINVCVIVDASNMKQAYSKVHTLIKNKVPVWRYNPALNPHYKKNGLSEPFMHHKCIEVDDDVVVTGSANLTKAGQKSNIENINILRDKQAIDEHRQEFERLKKYCIECKE